MQSEPDKAVNASTIHTEIEIEAARPKRATSCIISGNKSQVNTNTFTSDDGTRNATQRVSPLRLCPAPVVAIPFINALNFILHAAFKTNGAVGVLAVALGQRRL